MSKQLILNKLLRNKDEKKFNEVLFLLPKKTKFKKGKIKLSQLERFLSNKYPLKIKINYYQNKNLYKNYSYKNFNKNNQINKDFIISNYKSKFDYPLSPKNNDFVSNKLLNNINQFNKTQNDNYKVLLPNINISRNLKKNFFQLKEKSFVFRRNLKEVKLRDLVLKEDNLNNDNYIIKKMKGNRYINSNSEWNIFKEKKKKDNKKDLLHKNKSINLKYNNDNSSEEKYKNGAERLKEFHKKKLNNYNILIEKMSKLTEDRKNVITKYLQLMKDNVEKNQEFNIEN